MVTYVSFSTHTFANIGTICRLSSGLASVKGDTFQLVTDLAPAVRERVLLNFQVYSVTVILTVCVCVCVCVSVYYNYMINACMTFQDLNQTVLFCLKVNTYFLHICNL